MDNRIALVNCPMWDIEFTAYNIALLSAVLKQHNFEVDCFDFNHDLYSSKEDHKGLWNLNNLYAFWQSPVEVKSLFEKEAGFINNFLEKLKPYRIIGFSVQTLNFVFTIELASLVKNKFPDKFIIIGGPECFRNFNPEFLIKNGCFDALCCGEAEEALPELIKKFIEGEELKTRGFFVKQENNILDCGDTDLIRDLDSLPFADYTFLDKDTKNISISTSRGCICNCSFCHEKAHWNKFRSRSANSVFQEAKSLKNKFPSLELLYFNDSLINGNIKEFENFCDLMISENLGVHWAGHALIRKEMTTEILKKMKLAGAQRLNFGVESGSDYVLGLMRKSFSSDLALEFLQNIKQAGISFSVNLIVGFPGEREEDFRETYNFYQALSKLTDRIHVNPCLVLHGTQLYNEAKQRGIVLPQNYVTDWYLEDGTNTPEIRKQRLKELSVQ
jgi:radical SAM superfamily enzyme YgiQ (UPF0313 family)